MNEDRFEELLRDVARDYHQPPHTPREEMWAAIAADRERLRLKARVHGSRPAWRWGLGMAAVLLVGIAIGRFVRPGGSPQQSAAPGVTATGAQPSLAYRVVTAQYLARTETLLTGFRADARGGQLDAQFAAQARQLLGSTRLLLDSPTGRDPQLQPLLEDLELVLAQIAVLPAARDTQDVDLINRGIEQRSVLTRLRTAMPAGLATAARVQGVL